MSRFLGIDYGSKRVGVAISDEGKKIAFPKIILENDQNLIKKIKEICRADNVSKIVVGESLSRAGMPNPIEKEIQKFIRIINKEINLPIERVSEIWSSIESKEKRFIKPGTQIMKHEARRMKNAKVDASAAAIILQRYLEKNNDS